MYHPSMSSNSLRTYIKTIPPGPVIKFIIIIFNITPNTENSFENFREKKPWDAAISILMASRGARAHQTVHSSKTLVFRDVDEKPGFAFP